MSLKGSANLQGQETIILEAAAKSIEESSLLDFTMSAISKEAGMSMGSIYKHIKSKEDVLVALGFHSQVHFMELVNKVMAFPLPLNARFVAIQLIDSKYTSPYHFGDQLVTLLGNEAILKRASSGWVEKYIACDAAIDHLFQDQLSKASEEGELIIESEDRELVLNEIITATWALCVGYSQVIQQRNVRSFTQNSTRLESDAVATGALKRLLNSYQWKEPLTDELIEMTCQKLKQEGLR
jgi:AcrR family transcriptional regulator